MELSNLKKDPTVRRKKNEVSSLMYGKVPPQARDLEEAVLGAIMLERGAFDTAVEILRSECFYVEAHQLIFKAMKNLSDKTMPIDLLTVVEELKSSGDIEIIGGPYYLTRLTNIVSSSANMEAHARIVLQKFIQRELIRISGEIIKEAFEDSTDVFDLMDLAEQKLYGITDTHLRKNYTSIGDVLKQTLERIEALRESDEDISGVPSGYQHMDGITRGWQPTDLVILAARPSVGKTAFALNLALNAATDSVKPTPSAIFSLEMSAGQIVQRMLSMKSEVLLERLSSGKMEDYEMKQLMVKGVEPLSETDVFIDDTPALNMFELRAKCRRLKHKNNLGLVIIDYLQLMTGGNDKNSNREQEISKISRDLKGLAKELNLPIIALSQLSREVERRRDGNKMPMLSDLRESGAIEQDADMVLFLYRPEYHDQDTDEMGESIKGLTQVKIAKHRNGRLATVSYKAQLDIQRFVEIEDPDGSGDYGGKYDAFDDNNSSMDGDDSSVFIQKESRMNDMSFDDEDSPF
ncbi:MAG TPA: replicative DNA helicase [Chitinophagaceae bacterium]|nr:replicative DNA helicase [Chitinophagaceae bacterium]